MAFASDSTTAPARPLLPFTFRPVPPVNDPRSADDLIEEIRRTIEGQEAFGFSRHDIVTADLSDRSSLRSEGWANRCDIPTHEQEADASGYPDACLGDTPKLLPVAAALPGSGDLKSNTVLDIPHGAVFDPANSGDLKAARALHMRRELDQALDYGFTLLDALDLPPLALDVIDDAIRVLDALEAPDEDREDDDPAEGTSLETAGRGFVRAGADDDEEDDGCERGEEYGSEDGEDIGHHASQFRPFPLSHTERAEVAVIAARAQAMRRAAHV